MNTLLEAQLPRPSRPKASTETIKAAENLLTPTEFKMIKETECRKFEENENKEDSNGNG